MKRNNYSLRVVAALVLTLSFTQNARAQDEACGTEVPPGFYEKMQERVQTLDFQKHKTHGVAASSIPIQFIVGRNDDGSNSALTSTQKQNVLNELNTRYASMSMSFFEYATPLYIDNTSWNTNFQKTDDNLLPAYEVANVVNVFVFKTVISGSSSICGYAKFPNGGNNDNRVILQSSCSQNGSTSAHELGHYFSLFHTHQGGNELVQRTNCTFAGDLFCDTEADPNISGLVNTSCIYTGTGTDANGDTYIPDPNNVMSYSRKSCRTFFSSEQQTAILASLNSDRSYLLSSGGISTFPYNEGFESGLGNWVNETGDNLNWTRDASGTPSTSTGPSSGQGSTYYMYVESSISGTGYPTKTAEFTSPTIDMSAMNNPEMSFGYHMYGSSMGTLELRASTNGGSSWTVLWSKTGDQGNSWFTADLSLAAYQGQSILLQFRGTTGTSYRSDFAIDNITIEESSANTSVINTFPYLEGFEAGYGVWQNASGDDMEWTRDANGTTSTSTGPSDGQTGSYYLYTEASSPNYPSKIADLISPTVDLSGISAPVLKFGYHMYGSAMGSLQAQVSTNGGSSWSTLWSQSGDLGNSWYNASIDLTSYAGSSILIKFKGTTGTSYRSDMAIDNVFIDDDGADENGSIENASIYTAQESSLQLFPNPANGNTVNIEIDNTGNSRSAILEVFSLDGKRIYTETVDLVSGANEIELNIASYKRTLYKVVLIMEDKSILSSQLLIEQ